MEAMRYFEIILTMLHRLRVMASALFILTALAARAEDGPPRDGDWSGATMDPIIEEGDAPVALPVIKPYAEQPLP